MGFDKKKRPIKNVEIDISILIFFLVLIMLKINDTKPNRIIKVETMKWNIFADLIGKTIKVIPTAANIIELITKEIREI